MLLRLKEGHIESVILARFTSFLGDLGEGPSVKRN